MRWIKWAFCEALFRTVSMTLIKIIGSIAQGLTGITISTLIIGATQTVVSTGIIINKKIDVFPSRQLILGSIGFGIGAFVNTIIGFMAYVYGADITVYTFITLLAIVPGAFIDKIWFGQETTFRQSIGIILAIIAGWLILKTPNLQDLLEMPVWVWLAFANAFFLSVNQGISRSVKNVNIWVKNLWGGFTTFILCLMTLVFFGENIAETLTKDLILWSTVISLVVIGIWSFNIIAYRDGGAIPTKNVAVNGTFLSLILVVGILFFGETITPIQIAGIIVYLFSFIIINNETWNYIVKKM